MIKILIVLYFCCIKFSSLNFLRLPSNSSDALSQDCVNDILFTTVKNNEVIYSVNVDLNINLPIIKFNTTETLKNVFKLAIQPDVYVLKETPNIEELIKKLYFKGLFNPRGKFIILTNKLKMSTFKILEDNFIYKVIIILKGIVNNSRIVKKRKFKIINALECHDSFNNRIDAFRYTIREKIRELNIIYQKQPPYVISPKEGLNTEIVNLIASSLKVKPNYKLSNLSDTIGFVDENGQTTGMLLDVRNGKFDLSINILISFFNEYLYFDITIPIMDDVGAFIVARNRVTDYWKMFYEEFTLTVWICLFASIVICYVILYMIQKNLPNAKHNSSLFINILRLFLEGTSPIKSDSQAFNILFLFVLFNSFILTTLYKSKQFNFMNTDQSYQRISSEQDIFKYKLRIVLNKGVFMYNAASDKPLEKLLNKYDPIICNQTISCMYMTAFNKDLVGIHTLRTVKYYISKELVDSEGKSLIYILRSDHMRSYFYWFFRKGHPLFEQFNEKLLKAREAGLIDYIYKRNDMKTQRAIALTQTSNTFQAKPLKLEVLQSTFYVYFVFIAISTVVFLLEITRYFCTCT